MFYDLFLLLAGIYIGQEYDFPSVKNITLSLYGCFNSVERVSFIEYFKNYIKTHNE